MSATVSLQGGGEVFVTGGEPFKHPELGALVAGRRMAGHRSG